MGAATSLLTELPERLTINDIESILIKHKLNVKIDMVRFNLLKDCSGSISRAQALQLIENKLPPIYSLNGALS
jgi:hypothetical protein